MKHPVAIRCGITRFWKGFSVVTALLVMGILQACATQQPEENQSLARMDQQIRELEDKMDESYHRLSVIQFMVDNHERQLRELNPSSKPMPGSSGPDSSGTFTEETMPAGDGPATPPPSPAAGNGAPSSPHMLYNKALAAYKKSDFTAAAEDFNTFILTYPRHELTDNAVYWKGECQYAQKDFPGAITTFKQVLSQYPDGGKVPDALLKIGYSYLALNDKENARTFLKQAVKNYPFSPAGTKAEQMLKKIR
ncbi:MAG: tol-pal system protein YbgF [Thermodesulfobacteriota bacterium]